MAMTIEQLVIKAREDGASDIHLIYGLPPIEPGTVAPIPS